MELILQRIYLPGSTVGTLYVKEANELQFCSFTMELPWRSNARSISCIPEGTYQATYERHARFGDVYRLINVPQRIGILIHAGNSPDDLRGCIAPVTTLTNDRYGEQSAIAKKKLMDLTEKKPVRIKITSGQFGLSPVTA